MAQLSCCVKIETSSRQITAEFVVQVVQSQFGSRCAGPSSRFRHNCCYTLSRASSEWVRSTVACAGARRSSEVGFGLVTDAQKNASITDRHTKCQSFL